MSQILVTGEAKIRDIQGPVVANSGVITALDGAASQYVRGDGTLADFPTSSGGGSSVSYYLNTSVSQGTIGGVDYKELNKEPIIGTGTDIAISSNGYVASYLTDANDPDVLSIPGGNFNCEFYFSVNNNTGNPFFYAELYKYDGTTFTLLGSSVGVPEYINQGTIIAPYYFAIPVATAALALTDRLAIRIYVNVDGRTVTLHTENGHLCQVVTTLSKGMVSLNNLTDQSQFLTTGTSGTDFNIVSSGDTHTFNIPSAGVADRGLITNLAQTIGGAKTFSSVLRTDGGFLLKDSTLGTVDGYTSIGGVVGSISIGYAISSTPYINDLEFAPATSNTYTFPNASGTIALTSNLSSYVPYTGATTNVDLGVNTLTALGVIANNFSAIGNTNPSGNGGYIFLKQGIGPFTYDTGYNSITANSTRFLLIANVDDSNNKSALFELGSLSNNTSRTFTLPDITGTLALLEGTQTFTGVKSFDTGVLIKNGVSPTASGYTGIGAGTSGISVSLGAGGGGSLIFQSTSYNYTFPAASGTIALTSNLSSYVPYTGATGAVNLGAFDLTVNGLTVGRGGGSISTNTVLGTTALSSNTTGASNVAIGINSLNTNTTGGSNVAVGQSSLQTNNSNQNTAIGNQAMQFNTTGTANTGIGHTALQNNTTGNNNIAIGYESGINITTGSNNTIIGAYAGTTTLANNIILADGAGNIRYQWDGTNNVFGNPISGTSASFASSGGSDSFAINHSSGSGIALNITKGGNGEGLYINKTSGSGNAATIIGTLNATTLVKSGGTSSQYLMADGSTSTLTNPVTGTGTTNYLPKFTGASTIGNSIVQDDATTVTVGGQLYVNRNDSNVIKVARNGGSDLNTVIEFANASTSAYIGSNGTLFGLGGTTGSIAAQPFIIVPSSSEKMRLDTSGNLGLGVTPSAWSQFTALQLGGNTYSAIASSNNYIIVSANTVYDGSDFKYITTGAASRYQQSGASHQWHIAPSGTAGNAISFTQAMTLTAEGNLGIGNVNQGSDGGVIPRLAVANPSNADKFVGIGYNNTGDYGFIHSIHRATAWKNLAIQAFGGNVLIGTTTDAGYKLDVNGTGRFSSNLRLETGASDSLIIFKNNASSNVRSLSYNVADASFSFNSTGGSQVAIISNSGAATFSSNVTATGTITMNKTGGYGILAQDNGNNAAANGAYIGWTNTANTRYYIGQLDTNNDLNYYYFNGSSWSTSIMKFSNTGAATFSSSVTTGAPSGGTAKPFKIGAAATVSPTSPNRTIEIEIDGTTYYLSAKTTND